MFNSITYTHDIIQIHKIMPYDAKIKNTKKRKKTIHKYIQMKKESECESEENMIKNIFFHMHHKPFQKSNIPSPTAAYMADILKISLARLQISLKKTT